MKKNTHSIQLFSTLDMYIVCMLMLTLFGFGVFSLLFILFQSDSINIELYWLPFNTKTIEERQRRQRKGRSKIDAVNRKPSVTNAASTLKHAITKTDFQFIGNYRLLSKRSNQISVCWCCCCCCCWCWWCANNRDWRLCLALCAHTVLFTLFKLLSGTHRSAASF